MEGVQHERNVGRRLHEESIRLQQHLAAVPRPVEKPEDHRLLRTMATVLAAVALIGLALVASVGLASSPEHADSRSDLLRAQTSRGIPPIAAAQESRPRSAALSGENHMPPYQPRLLLPLDIPSVMSNRNAGGE